jgi:hypothetical protein
MNVLHGTGARDHQVLVASVELFSSEVVGGESLPLEMGTGCPVKDDDLFVQNVQE